ncbi:MAG: hypothetical protein H0X25_22725 [Acidobacteriales bacterium]|nr:hypothetical protein [Terriglobales bacterium]
MTARPQRRRRTRSSSSIAASVSGIPAKKKPPQSVRSFAEDPFIQLSDLKASTQDWSALVVVMCVCGWDMDMNGAAAYCTNPCCQLRTRLYHVELKISEVDRSRA